MRDRLEEAFARVRPTGVDRASLRWQSEHAEHLMVRQGVVQPVRHVHDDGVMVTVGIGDGEGYAATSDLSDGGLKRAFDRAKTWAERSAGRSVLVPDTATRAPKRGTYTGPAAQPWAGLSTADKLDLLRREDARMNVDPQIVDWHAALQHVNVRSLHLDDVGSRIEQNYEVLVPIMGVVANKGADTQVRTLGGYGLGRQGGLEVLDTVGFGDAAPRLAEEAVALLSAPDCPTGTMDVILAPDQMILQIHESIGHPLELDRILGDERNYAGTSFVTQDMFGTYRYGSDLLNVTFDPTVDGQLASYAFDDEGTPAERTYIIQEGMLKQPLGGATSQRRAQMGGVATARACSWNRPPIDRMANLNLEPGDQTEAQLIAQVERGVYMATNCSWSIDDSRNKFQFGCEYGRMIEDGKLTDVVRKPNYRGISATFWRNLKGVGDASTWQIMGTPNCGKGEPNQMVRVGHASPTCLFGDVAVFGGA